VPPDLYFKAQEIFGANRQKYHLTNEFMVDRITMLAGVAVGRVCSSPGLRNWFRMCTGNGRRPLRRIRINGRKQQTHAPRMLNHYLQGRYADFHALRYTWATFLQRNGVVQQPALINFCYASPRQMAGLLSGRLAGPFPANCTCYTSAILSNIVLKKQGGHRKSKEGNERNEAKRV
jgi:hypothetical protein